MQRQSETGRQRVTALETKDELRKQLLAGIKRDKKRLLGDIQVELKRRRRDLSRQNHDLQDSLRDPN